ncbi:MAG: 5,6-dimethylbenzimidazole synthase [Pseudomonadota bacterium]
MEFTSTFKDEFDRLLHWRRDVRRFKTTPVPEAEIEYLLQAAGAAPSVGLSEPWRFVRVESQAARAAIRENYAASNAAALQRYSGADAEHYASLKLAGLDAAPVQLAVYCDDGDDKGKGLGQATMPQTRAYSTVCAIMQLWLAARTRGIGVGWVSILDVERVQVALQVPADWTFIAYLCIGYPQEEHSDAELERFGWEPRAHVAHRVMRV